MARPVCPPIAADVIVEIGTQIVLIERKHFPFGWAIPGGFVDFGETVEDAAAREILEETSLEVELRALLGVYSRPDRDPRAQLAAARRAVRENEVHRDQARLTLNRLTQLIRDGLGTQADVDQAKSEVEATEARIAALEEQITVAERQVEVQQTDLDNTVIRAPFSGIAISKDAQPGEMVSPVSAGGGFTRTGICTIVDMRSLEIEVDVNESYINRVTPGQHVTASIMGVRSCPELVAFSPSRPW